MNTIFTISQILIDTFAMLAVVLLVEVLFGASMVTNRKKYAIAAVVYLTIECIMELNLGSEYDLLITFVEYGMMAVITFIFATKKRIRTALLTFPAVFCYLQWFYMISLVEMLFGLDKYSTTINDVEITPAYFVSEITLITILEILESVFNYVIYNFMWVLFVLILNVAVNYAVYHRKFKEIFCLLC